MRWRLRAAVVPLYVMMVMPRAVSTGGVEQVLEFGGGGGDAFGGREVDEERIGDGWHDETHVGSRSIFDDAHGQAAMENESLAVG